MLRTLELKRKLMQRRRLKKHLQPIRKRRKSKQRSEELTFI